jgi:hypothetical protein
MLWIQKIIYKAHSEEEENPAGTFQQQNSYFDLLKGRHRMLYLITAGARSTT